MSSVSNLSVHALHSGLGYNPCAIEAQPDPLMKEYFRLENFTAVSIDIVTMFLNCCRNCFMTILRTSWVVLLLLFPSNGSVTVTVVLLQLLISISELFLIIVLPYLLLLLGFGGCGSLLEYDYYRY